MEDFIMKYNIVAIVLLLMITTVGFSLEIIKGPYLQNVSQTAITIMWETDRWAEADVRYGEQGNVELNHSKIDENYIRIHEIRIEGLVTETYYRYKVISETKGGERVESKVYTFRTAPYRNTPFRLAVWGDNRTDYRTCEKITKLIALQNPDIVVNVGDVVTNGDNYSEWGREYFAPIKHFGSSVSSYIAIGNHEEDSHWFDDFVSQPGNEHWFAFTYGNSRFVLLDTNRFYHKGSEQYNWLLEELNSNDFKEADFKFAFFHHPPYSEQWDSPGYTGESGVRFFLVPLLEECGVDIVFSGHTHDYERGRKTLKDNREIYYIITGGGGSVLDRFETKDWDVIQLHRSVYHCVVVDVNGNSLDFRAIDLDGEVIDSFNKTGQETITTIAPSRGKLFTTWASIKAK